MKSTPLICQAPKSFIDRVIAGDFATPVVLSSVTICSFVATRAAFFDPRDTKKLRNGAVALRNLRNLTLKRAATAAFLGVYTGGPLGFYGGSLLHFGVQVSVLGISKYFNKKV